MMRKTISTFLLLATCVMMVQAGLAGKVKKLFKMRANTAGKLYFIRDFPCKVTGQKHTAFFCDFTYNSASERVNDSVVMNFTVEQDESIRNFQQVAIVRGADTVFTNDYSVRYYTKPEGDHWKNRHSVILSRKAFYTFLQFGRDCVIMLQYDNRKIFCHIPPKYHRAYQAICSIMTTETNYPIDQL